MENVIINTWHGTMLVNRFDVAAKEGGLIGVGLQLLKNSEFDRREVEDVVRILKMLKQERDRPIVAYDIGANIGCHCLVWARELGKGIDICAAEAQRRLFMMLCGNIVINNHSTITARNVAVGGASGTLRYLEPDYSRNGSFGSLELRRTETSEDIGQKLDPAREVSVDMVTLAGLYDKPADFIKLDIEGMEEECLLAARDYLAQHRPLVFFEHIKSDQQKLVVFFESLNYRCILVGMNILAISREDSISGKINAGASSVPDLQPIQPE